jgi:hypothetical protein
VLDHFRHKFALNAELLKAEKLRELSKRCTQELNEHWGIDPDADDLIEARVLVLERVDERLPAPVGALLSARSKIGRDLRLKLGIRADEYNALIPQLLQRLTAHGLLARVQDAAPMYQLNVASLMWCKGRRDAAGQRASLRGAYSRHAGQPRFSSSCTVRSRRSWRGWRRASIPRRWWSAANANGASDASAARQKSDRCPTSSARPRWSWASTSPT